MADNTATEIDDDRWRRKYYATLEQLERQHENWERTEGVLRQALLRLSLLAQSDNPSLAEQVNALRLALRRGQDMDSLEPILATLSDHILRSEEEVRSRAQVPRDLLLDLLDRIDFPRASRSRVRDLQQRLTDSAASDLQLFVAEVAELIGAPSGPQAPQPRIADQLLWEQQLSTSPLNPGARGLLGRLAAWVLPRRKGDEVYRIGPIPDAESGADFQAALARELDDLHDLAGDSTGEDATLPPLHEVLLRLLERLAIPAELQEPLEALKESLSDGLPPDQVEETLGAIADLIQQMQSRIQHEKHELEDFLRQITGNLEELDHSFLDAIAMQQESLQQGRDLESAVSEQVQVIEDSVSAIEDDLLPFKQQITQRLRTIQNHLEAFREMDEGHGQRAEQQVASLTRSLAALEEQVDRLREQVRLERDQALIDPLTGIPNRLAYDERLADELARWQRDGTPLVLMVCDVDRFKRINDGYGHQAGDKVLRVIARLLNRQVRESDFVGRYGGEEFVLLMPDTELRQALVVADKLRQAVAEADFHYRGGRVQITISCGLAQFSTGDDPAVVFRRADSALYKAKAAGRNRCLTESGA